MLGSHSPANKNRLLATFKIQRQKYISLAQAAWQSRSPSPSPGDGEPKISEAGFGLETEQAGPEAPRPAGLLGGDPASRGQVSAATSPSRWFTRAGAPFSASRPRCRSGWRPAGPAWHPRGCSGGPSWPWAPSGM